MRRIAEAARRRHSKFKAKMWRKRETHTREGEGRPWPGTPLKKQEDISSERRQSIGRGEGRKKETIRQHAQAVRDYMASKVFATATARHPPSRKKKNSPRAWLRKEEVSRKSQTSIFSAGRVEKREINKEETRAVDRPSLAVVPHRLCSVEEDCLKASTVKERSAVQRTQKHISHGVGARRTHRRTYA